MFSPPGFGKLSGQWLQQNWVFSENMRGVPAHAAHGVTLLDPLQATHALAPFGPATPSGREPPPCTSLVWARGRRVKQPECGKLASYLANRAHFARFEGFLAVLAIASRNPYAIIPVKKQLSGCAKISRGMCNSTSKPLETLSYFLFLLHQR